MEPSKPEEKSFVRRDKLIKFEKEAQKLWQDHKIHEVNPVEGVKKFMVTFPYPYMNGRLHLGHAYSMSKCEFTVRYKKLKGYNALWPFSYHCTGMPIVASAEN
jgi:leucyl-tRNA synthetase